ncbi:N-acetylglucosamine-6-phosphate deacetylase [Mumia flava]|uniref:N-acetylglucosamine-6-phosphate deacetylase n=1 Tax=Mumia flava TaxID=1348852 RepID=A0A2M9BFK3_9ACTN|nr:N-acetylglucosamine-6-phosphate deacetylase [Mumia flava]
MVDGQVVEDVAVTYADGVVSSVEQGDRDPSAPAWLLPGFVDLHCHGGGGASFDGGRAAAERAAATHGRSGTTAMLASLVSAPVDVIVEQVRDLAAAIASGLGPVVGIHLEGPFLSPQHRGAHDPEALVAPTRESVERLVEAGDGHLRMVTLAPELDGATEAIGLLTEAGVRVAVGHTDTDYAGARAAFDAGATILTHASNAMRPVHHRAPGPVVAALDSAAFLEVILDGVHLHDAWARRLLVDAGRSAALVTDAMAAAGASDGQYDLGGLDVEVRDGVARLTGSGAIAGSTLTMDRAVRRAVLDLGLDPAAASAAASLAPASALGLPGGVLEVGAAASFVALGDDLRPVGVVREGDAVV